MKKYAKYAGIGLLILLLIAGIYTWNPHPAAPSAESLAAGADQYDVEIIRDEFGVPHIYGKSDADAAFGMGYAHAEDDFATIQERVIAVRGELANIKGADAAITDYLVSLFEVWETIDEKYESDVPQNIKDISKAYADGLNLYASQHPEELAPGFKPFTEEDATAGSIFITPFFYGLDKELLKLAEPGRNLELSVDPATGVSNWIASPQKTPPRGSNAFAVSPERSGDGVTRLIINSHQPMTGPVAWYEAHMVSEEGLNINGATFPGSPFVLQGFTPYVGWANTVNNPDLVDVYQLNINPDNEYQYGLDGEWVDFERKSVEIDVRLFGPFALTVEEEVLRSKHGPVLKNDNGTFAIRYAGMGEVRQLEQRLKYTKAKNFAEFNAAMAMNALPSINYVFADREGTVAIIHNGQYPNRIDGWDWSKDMPGDRSELIWQGYRPYSFVPVLSNPESGFIWNANNRIYNATDGSDNLKPEDFPTSMLLQDDHTNRSLRILELSDPTQPISRERLLAMKFDNSYAQKSLAASVVREILAHDWSDDARLQAAADHLRAWDFSSNIESRHAALGVLSTLKATTERYTGEKAPPPLEAFRLSVNYLHKYHGRIDPTWGAVNRLKRGDVNIPISGAPDVLRAIYPLAVRPDGQLHANAGDTWIGLVEWDKDGNQSAEIIHQFGSATIRRKSKHYADQAPIFAAQKWRKAHITRADVEAAATERYHPTDKN